VSFAGSLLMAGTGLAGWEGRGLTTLGFTWCKGRSGVLKGCQVTDAMFRDLPCDSCQTVLVPKLFIDVQAVTF
jgi:hypothetical protein